MLLIGTNEAPFCGKIWVDCEATDAYTKTECRYVSDIFVTGCTGSCQSDNLQASHDSHDTETDIFATGYIKTTSSVAGDEKFDKMNVCFRLVSGKTMLRLSYLYNGVFYIGKTTFLYWTKAQFTISKETGYPSPTWYTRYGNYQM